MKFQKGTSGNPSGRPKNPTSAMLRAGIAERLPELINAVMEQALAGDMGAAKILIDRCLPVLKPQAEPLVIRFDGDMQETINQIMTALSEGELSAEDAGQLLKLIGAKIEAERGIDKDKKLKAFDLNFI